MEAGDQVYITRVAYPERRQIEQHCTRLTVEHVRPKAVLVQAGEHMQWIPRSALTPSTNAPDVYLLARWLKMSPAWMCRCGTPRHEAAGRTGRSIRPPPAC